MVSLRLPLVATLCVFAACGAAGGGGGNDAPVTPTSPSSGTAGGWTGTLSRPNGNPPMTVSWQAEQSGNFLTGPMTLTNAGNSAIVTGAGEVLGDERSGYTLFISLRATAGQVPGRPNCTIIGGSPARPGIPFPQPFRAITAAPITMGYTSCQGFMDPPPQRTDVSESSELTLTKQ